MPKKPAKKSPARKKQQPVVQHKTRLDANREIVARRMDGWRSVLSGLNTSKDKRTYSTFTADPINWQENLELWRGDDLAGRIVETIPNEMMREGWELCVEGKNGKEIETEVMSFLEEFDFDAKLHHGLCAERALGGAGIVMGVNDLKTMAQPLDLSKAKALNFLEVFEPSELQVAKWQNDPTKARFGQPLTYRLNPVSPGGASKGGGVEIHESRIIVFPGIRVTRRQVTAQAGWGDAVLSRCRDTLRDFQTAWASAGLLVADFSQAIWKIKGLAEIISLDKGDELANRIAAMELARSIVRASVIDADGEEFERKQTPITGLPELLQQFATRLAASADMPVTLLMGMSPAGMNATGESDARSFYDRVKSNQRRKLKPAIEKVVRVAFGALDIEEPEDWYVEFHPLWQPTEQESAQTRLTQMQIDQGYVEMQVYSAETVKRERFGGRQYSFNTHIEESDIPEEPDTSAIDTPEYQAMLAQTGKGPKAPAVKTAPTSEAPPVEEKPAERQDMIEKRGSKWVVLTEDGKDVLGTHDNEKDAETQLRVIEEKKAARLNGHAQ